MADKREGSRRQKRLGYALVALLLASSGVAQAPKRLPVAKGRTCSRVVIDGKVKAGESFVRLFAGQPGAGMELMLEALPSGWIVRVLPAGVARGQHDYAELATPPYRSVSPLLISTDFSFRAQDAVAWNPRRFRYAANAAEFDRLARLYPGVMGSDAKAEAEVAGLVGSEPEAELDILSSAIAPGTADQWRMAAAVALHLADTPHEVVAGAKPTPLGRIESLEFRVKLDLRAGQRPASGLAVEQIPCNALPTS
ncbi:MAG: hypothetical protein V4555_16175 [Acidobacteriota bacterium]